MLPLIVTVVLAFSADPAPEMIQMTSSNPSDNVIDPSADSIKGRTIRWTWSEGPTAGVTHEHLFSDDGTVTWQVLSGPQEGHSAEEKEYEVFEVSETVYAVSYLAASGYTLTVVLNFETGEMFGFASGQDQWFPGRGTFEVVR